MAQTTNDIKNGSVLNLDGQLWAVIKFQHVKPGTVETGAEIQVPLFIGEGEKVKVNTTDGSYLGREN